MNDEHKIIQQVYAAKEDMKAADRLIGSYMPFIKAETAKFLKRPPMEGHDDELSIAMIAFHEAIRGYSHSRGAFLKYAAMLIKSRLIDYHRKEQKHNNVISLDTPAGEEDTPLGDTIADEADHNENLLIREATRTEIEELTRQMQEFGVSLTDVAENCPKQQRTLEACRKALWYAKGTLSFWKSSFRQSVFPSPASARAAVRSARRWNATENTWSLFCWSIPMDTKLYADI